jgi:hypothetical protein
MDPRPIIRHRIHISFYLSDGYESWCDLTPRIHASFFLFTASSHFNPRHTPASRQTKFQILYACIFHFRIFGIEFMWRNSQYQILETPSTAGAQARISDGRGIPLQVVLRKFPHLENRFFLLSIASSHFNTLRTQASHQTIFQILHVHIFSSQNLNITARLKFLILDSHLPLYSPRSVSISDSKGVPLKFYRT